MKARHAKMLLVGGLAAVVLAMLLAAGPLAPGPVSRVAGISLLIAGVAAGVVGLVYFILHPVRRGA